MAKVDAGDWYSYQAEKTRPKASYERPMPPRDKLKEMGQNDRVTEIERPAARESIEVRELASIQDLDESPSMIQRIIGKFSGGG